MEEDDHQVGEQKKNELGHPPPPSAEQVASSDGGGMNGVAKRIEAPGVAAVALALSSTR
jgi:hypothetical protein